LLPKKHPGLRHTWVAWPLTQRPIDEIDVKDHVGRVDRTVTVPITVVFQAIRKSGTSIERFIDVVHDIGHVSRGESGYAAANVPFQATI
jgi:hypothetical protein